eukprot:1799919-Rhodomonas_salina.3
MPAGGGRGCREAGSPLGPAACLAGTQDTWVHHTMRVRHAAEWSGRRWSPSARMRRRGGSSDDEVRREEGSGGIHAWARSGRERPRWCGHGADDEKSTRQVEEKKKKKRKTAR